MNDQANEPTKIMLTTRASLLPLAKSTITTYQAKLFLFAKVFLGLYLSGLLLVSCASASGSDASVSVSKRAGNMRWADYGPRENRIISVSTIDGEDIARYCLGDPLDKKYGYSISQGVHAIGITTTWSNRFEDQTQLALDVKEGRSYVIYAYELEKGQDPYASVFNPKGDQKHEHKEYGGRTSLLPSVKDFVLASLLPFISIASPVWIPGKYLYEKTSEGSRHNMANTQQQPTDSVVETVAQPPDSPLETETKSEETVVATFSQNIELPPASTARPFDGCCYVWIEDAGTREVVAGTRLPGANG
jgi:hypothetical protein